MRSSHSNTPARPVRGYAPGAIDCPGLRFYDNPRYHETNMVHTLFCAERELDGDVIVSYTDIAYSPAVVRRLLDASGDIAVVIDRDWQRLWRERMSDPLADAESLRLDAAGNIVELGKKPGSYADIEGHPEQVSVRLALEELSFFSREVKILGVYPAHEYRRAG